MGLSIPPMPLLDVEERIRNGAKTLEEIDPEFHKWYKRQQRAHIFGTSCILAAIIIAVITAAILNF